MKLNFYDIIYILFLQYFFKKFGNIILVKINLIILHFKKLNKNEEL